MSTNFVKVLVADVLTHGQKLPLTLGLCFLHNPLRIVQVTSNCLQITNYVFGFCLSRIISAGPALDLNAFVLQEGLLAIGDH